MIALRFLICGMILVPAVVALPQPVNISGEVLTPGGQPLAGARVEFASHSGIRIASTTTASGDFVLALPASGLYTVRVQAAGFADLLRPLDVESSAGRLTFRLEHLAAVTQNVIVSSTAGGQSLESPDPSRKVMVREELLDANPGRPGAPVSIPGMPIETASGGIKAPQYFLPGVAGDHGEPVAQYVAVGAYLASNNLSANAHGNGYADPNIYIPAALSSVATDGGAFNVLQGNHAVNLAATYSLRPRLARFLAFTGDNRDADLVAGFASANPGKKEWLALEASYGNGLMRTLEHRQQYKWNAMRVFEPGKHEITFLSIGYYGQSHEGNLVPLGSGIALNDTIDPRQKDQTHTVILAGNDLWEAGSNDLLSTSGYFRTYNLSLFSNFGEGLIRQSEFRTVEGAELRDSHKFAPWLQGMAGLDYNEDDIHRDNLDHYLSGNPNVYGAFRKVLANDITLRDIAPFAATHLVIGTHWRLYAGLRGDYIGMRNADTLDQEQSFHVWRMLTNPKATLAWSPGGGVTRFLPDFSFSMGQGFFTEDPRVGTETGSTSGPGALASPFERSHSEQLVIGKMIHRTDFELTLGRTTTTATLAKLDPDTGLAENQGPGILRYLTARLQHRFGFGMAQGIVSKADARDRNTGLPTPEAPRTIFDVLTSLETLPFGLRARAEYEYVGHRLLDSGNADHPEPYEAVPIGETRIALLRSFMDGRLQLGASALLARGYTGQTTETFAPDWIPGGPPPACPGGIQGIPNNFACGTVERAVGVRMVSWVGGSIQLRMNSHPRY